MKDSSKSSTQTQGGMKGSKPAHQSAPAPQPPESKCTLADLCPQDKKKVAGLLQQVVDLGQEVHALKKAKEQALSEAEELRVANQRLAKENSSAKSKLSQMLMLLKAYQTKVEELTRQIQTQQTLQPQPQTLLQAADSQSVVPKQPDPCKQSTNSTPLHNPAKPTAPMPIIQSSNDAAPTAPAGCCPDHQQATQSQTTSLDKQAGHVTTNIIPAVSHTSCNENAWHITSTTTHPASSTSSNSLIPLLSHTHSLQPLVSIPPCAHINIMIHQQPCQHTSHLDSTTSAECVHVHALCDTKAGSTAGQPSATSDGTQQPQVGLEKEDKLLHAQTVQQESSTKHATTHEKDEDDVEEVGVTTPRTNKSSEPQGKEVVISKDVLLAAASEPMEVTDVAHGGMTPSPGMKLRGDVSSPLLVTPLGAGGAAAASLLQWQMRQGLIKGIDDKAVSQIIGGKVLRFDPSIGQHGAFLFADVPQTDLANTMLSPATTGQEAQQPTQQKQEQQEEQPHSYGCSAHVPTMISKPTTGERVGDAIKDGNSEHTQSDALSDLTSELTLTSLPGTPNATNDAIQQPSHHHHTSHASMIDQQPARVSSRASLPDRRDQDAMVKLAQRLEAPLEKASFTSRRSNSWSDPALTQPHARQLTQKPCPLPSSPLLAMPASSNNSPVHHSKIRHTYSRYEDDRLQNQSYQRPLDSKVMLEKDQDLYSGRHSPPSSPRLHTTLCIGSNDKIHQDRGSRHRQDDYNAEQPTSAGSVSYGSRVAGNSLAIQASCMIDMDADLMDIIMQVDTDLNNSGVTALAVDTEEHSLSAQPVIHGILQQENDIRSQTYRQTELQHARCFKPQTNTSDAAFGDANFNETGTDLRNRMQQPRSHNYTNSYIQQHTAAGNNLVCKPTIGSGLARHHQQLDGHQAAICATLAAVQQSQLVEEQVQARLRASKPLSGIGRPIWTATRRQHWSGPSEALQGGNDMSDDDSEAVLSILHEDM